MSFDVFPSVFFRFSRDPISTTTFLEMEWWNHWFCIMIFPLMNAVIFDSFQGNVKTRERGMNAILQLCRVNAELSRRNTRKCAKRRVIHAATESKVIGGKLSTKKYRTGNIFLSQSNQIGTPSFQQAVPSDNMYKSFLCHQIFISY